MNLYETFLSSDTFVAEDTSEVNDYSDIRYFSDEAVYVYSLIDYKIKFAAGWDTLLGYANEEISMRKLISITTPDDIDFIREMNNQSLAFILGKTEHVKEYSCTIESKKFNKEGKEGSLLESVRVYRTRGGKVSEVVGTYKLNPRLPNPRQRHFHASGPGIEVLVDRMRQFGATQNILTRKQLEVLKLISSGKLNKEVSNHLLISNSSVEKMVQNMCEKFQVK
ncbi:MAG: response regulator transcription factor, partial [Sediminibacterium sp.]